METEISLEKIDAGKKFDWGKTSADYAKIQKHLQALYAKNDCYFPSRKRTQAAIESFAKKPERFATIITGVLSTSYSLVI